MAGFITDQALQDYVAAVLHRAGAAVTTDVTQSTFWPPIVTQANASAWGEIQDRLIRRGFTVAQITAWDRGAEVQQQIGTYNALRDGGCLENFSETFLNNLKRYFDPEIKSNILDNTLVTNAQVWQTPGDTPGTIGIGEISTFNNAFNLPTTPDQDPRIGEITRW